MIIFKIYITFFKISFLSNVEYLIRILKNVMFTLIINHYLGLVPGRDSCKTTPKGIFFIFTIFTIISTFC